MENGERRPLPEDDRLIDFERVKEVTGFAFRSVLRHKLLFVTVFGFTVVAAAAVYKTLPRHYRAAATLQLSKDPLLPAMVNPRRYYTRDLGPSPEDVLRGSLTQAFLLRLVDEHDLVEHWSDGRSLLQRARDAITSPLARPQTREQRRLVMLGTLQSRLHVAFKDQGRVEVSID